MHGGVGGGGREANPYPDAALAGTPVSWAKSKNPHAPVKREAEEDWTR